MRSFNGRDFQDNNALQLLMDVGNALSSFFRKQRNANRVATFSEDVRNSRHYALLENFKGTIIFSTAVGCDNIFNAATCGRNCTNGNGGPCQFKDFRSRSVHFGDSVSMLCV